MAEVDQNGCKYLGVLDGAEKIIINCYVDVASDLSAIKACKIKVLSKHFVKLNYFGAKKKNAEEFL